MSFLDRLKGMFSGGSKEGDARSDAPATPATPVDPAGMPTAEPQPAEPQAGEERPPQDRQE